MYPFDDAPHPVQFVPRGGRIKPLSPDESASTLKQLTGYSTSALQTGLHVLDTPGSIVRGGLGHLLGATPTEGERTSGRDLTDAIGLTSKRGNSWGQWAAGAGAEILTDPLTYWTGGAHHALTGAGSAAAKLGATKGFSRLQMLRGFDAGESGLRAAGSGDDVIRHLADARKKIASPEVERAIAETNPGAFTSKLATANSPAFPHPGVGGIPLGGLGGLGAPFKAPTVIFGTGPTAQKLAGHMDALGNKLKYGTMLGRWTNGLFDHRVGEAVGENAQRAHAQYGADALDAAKAQGRETTYRMRSVLDPEIRAGLPEEDLLRAARQNAEQVRVHGVDPSVLPAAAQTGTIMRDAEAAQRAESHSWGLGHDLGDQYASYFPRQGVDVRSAVEHAAGHDPSTRSLLAPQVVNRNNLPTIAGDDFSRRAHLRDIPGGSAQVDDLVREFAGSKLKPGVLAPTIESRLLAEAHQSGASSYPINMGRELKEKSIALTDELPHLPEQHSTHQIGLFSPNIVQDAARSAEQHARKMATAHTTFGFLGDHARGRSQLGPDNVPITQVLHDLGFNSHTPFNPDTMAPASGVYERAYRSLAPQGAGMVEPLMMQDDRAIRSALDKFGISRQHYNELMMTHQKASLSQPMSEPAGVFRQLTSTFKNLAYPTWIPSHVRNSVSAVLNNFMTGVSTADHGLAHEIIRGKAKADDLRQVWPDIPIGATDAQAIDHVNRDLYTHGKIYDGHAGQADIDQAIAAKLQSTTPGRITPELPGRGRAGAGTTLGDTGRLIGGGLRETAASLYNNIRHPQNPFADGGAFPMQGVWGATSDNPALATGRKVGSNIEDFFRAAKYISQKRAGATSQVAGQATRDLHFDYDKLTHFEKNVMRQVVPFYTYMRKNLPLQAGYLGHNPAFPLTQMRLMQAGRQSADYVPDYLSGGAAIPIGEQENGDQRYISGFGTPLEEALERLKFRNGLPDLRATAMAYAGGMNPFIKAPIEQIVDRQFHTGRQLSDLKAQGLAKGIGRTWGDENPQALAQFMANTPFTRFFSTFDKATDDRKPLWARAVNLGTGVRITDVDTQRQQATEAASARNEILRTMPHISQYTNFYPTRGEEGNMTPEEIRMLGMLRTMQLQGRATSKDHAQHVGLMQ